MNNKSNSTKQNLKDLLLNFLQNNSAHGFSKLVEANILKRTYWAFIMAFIWLTSIMFIKEVITGYFKYGVVTNYKIINSFHSEFPGVLIYKYDRFISCQFNNENCTGLIQINRSLFFNLGNIQKTF